MLDRVVAGEGPAGLTTAEARTRLAKDGANAIADVVAHPVGRLVGKFWAPVPWMLEAAILLQLVLGDYLEAAVVAVLLVFNAVLGFVQEGRAQATVDALRSRLALVASVRRDGTWATIPATALAAGDLVKLSLGSVVPADVRLATGAVLLDQSMLTGESLPVEAGAGIDAYAGALVRRGEATALVTATGERTKFGHTADLVRNAKVESSQQKAIMRVVRNLALFNGGVTMLLTAYAIWLPMPVDQIVPLVLIAVLSAIPVALPSMFTLAAAIGARTLARVGVLPTRLSAVDEAGGIDVLCCDKTGTLTRNELAVTAVRAMPGVTEARVLALAALASADGGQDPVDAAIQAEAARRPLPGAPILIAFTPFDPGLKRSEATVHHSDGTTGRVIKGAYAVVRTLCHAPTAADVLVEELEAKGFRVLAVSDGPGLAGLIALSDPPRPDSAPLIVELEGLGVRTVMVTGDALATAQVVAKSIGITGPAYATTPLAADIDAARFSLFAGVLPEDKYRLVQALQKTGHIVGMCGDGANDAAALRQAQMGIAVSTATDVAKASAGIVLTEPGLQGIVSAVKEGRRTFQRILTYTIRTIVHKTMQVLFLLLGLLVTGHAILTPLLMVMMMVLGDFLAMSSATDNVRPSSTPSVWRIGHLTVACLLMGLVDLVFCGCSLMVAVYVLHLDVDAVRSFTVVTLVFSGQALFYVARERGHFWRSRPGGWLLVSTVIDLSVVTVLALTGTIMAPLPVAVVGALFGAAIVFGVLLDQIKVVLFDGLHVG
jgi:H+-transporting ATPase